MSQAEREYVTRLGPAGLRRVLDDLLDPIRLVKLANACGLRYPGMRTQSQARDRILDDMVDRAQKEDAARRTIWRTLSKETATAARGFASAGPAERERRAHDDATLRASGALGLHLFLAANLADAEAGALLPVLLARCAASPAAKAAQTAEPEKASSREVARLRKKTQELTKKLQHLEGQLGKTRDVEKTLKRELLHRKGELAEARILAERLRRDLTDAQAAVAATTRTREKGGAAPLDPNASPSEELARALKKLVQDQRKLAHAVEKIAEAPAPAAELPAEALSPLLEALEALQKDAAAARKDRRKEEQQEQKSLEAIQAELRALREEGVKAPAAQKATKHRKGDAERVGVFVDVQNVYYAARQLKGKLDFDALLHAVVRDRRLIQAKAYVVESQEIDQSGFIAMLQQRNIEVRRKTLRIRSDGSMKGDWDMEMALEILDAAHKLDVVVLVSGDGDFTSLVNRVKGMGPRVEVAAFPRNTAKSLVEAADEFHPLDRKFMIRTGESVLPAREPGRASAPAPSKPQPTAERVREAAAAESAEAPPAAAQK